MSPYLKPGCPELTDPNDHLVIATARNGSVRLVAVRSTQTVEALRSAHDLSPAATIALGRLAVCAQLMASDLKNENDVMSISYRCEGALGGMVMVSDSHSRVRGYAAVPQVELQPDEEGRVAIRNIIGEGALTVIKDLGLREPYSGTVDLVSGEVAADLTYYLAVSEQIPSVMAAGVLLNEDGVEVAGGILVQMMPGATKEDVDIVEARAAGYPEVSFLLSEGFTPAQLLDLFMGDPAIKYLDARPVSFHCTCSRERMARNLITLGSADRAELMEDPKGIDLECHFCNATYHFDQDELKELFTGSVHS